MELDQDIRRAANALATARYVVALTGAGVSTPSGIPDFRSPNSGLWAQVDPFQVATLTAFRRNPHAFYDWVRPLVHRMLAAQPNPAHRALADLEEMGILKALVTQNIDGLHHRAGSRQVYEVHGHFRQVTCMHCYRTMPSTGLIESFLDASDVPRCPACGGVLKPNIILFGEQLPIRVLLAAQQAVRQSDVMLVAGSSLEVAPAGDLPLLLKQNGGQLIIVNLGPTHLDHLADLLIRADVAQALPRLVAAVRAIRTTETSR